MSELFDCKSTGFPPFCQAFDFAFTLQSVCKMFAYGLYADRKDEFVPFPCSALLAEHLFVKSAAHGADGAGGFLDTILGVLGGLGDILFGGGGDTSEDPTDDNDDVWGDEESTTNSGDSQVPNQGDTAVISVATIALVAGAALVLTRKKSEDAE